MIVFHSPSEIPSGFGPSVVTIGKFDGVHVGHRRLVDALVATARRERLRAVVVTFDRNPLQVLAPDRCPDALMSLPRRLELLDEAGADAVLVLRFTRELAAVPAESFVDDLLVGALHARVVFAGHDFRFGHRGAGDVSLLRARGSLEGFRVVDIPPVVVDGAPVSSTRIRDAMARGDVKAAAALLGRPPEVSGVVVHGLRRGRELGFPTANLGSGPGPDGVEVPVSGLIPADGVYAGWTVLPGDPDDGGRPSAISVGTNPTFRDDALPRTVESYLLDVDLDLYGAPVTIRFARFLRPMLAFDGVDELRERMREDVVEARAALSSPASP